VSVLPSLSGRLRAVRVHATDVDWAGVRLEQVRILARHVRLRAASVAAENVELQVELGQDALDEMLESGLPYAKLHLDSDGYGRAELSAHPEWGHVELAPAVDDGSLLLHPQAVVSRQGRRWAVPARVLPRLRIGAEVLLPGARLTEASVSEARLSLTAEVNDIDIPLRERRQAAVEPAALAG
jgi:hypothetical protein